MHYIKLITKHSLKPPYTTDGILARYGEYEGDIFYGYTSYKVTDEVSEALISIIPNKYRGDFYSTLLQINIPLPPHIDNGIHTSINFYVETANGITNVYKKDPNKSPVMTKLPNQTDGCLYRKEDLLLCDSFKANEGDVYVLDVKEIHSVDIPSNSTRWLYSLQTAKHSFNDVVAMLKEHQ